MDIDFLNARKIAHTVREPLVIFDKGLRIVAASRTFHELFHLSQGETEDSNLFEVGTGVLNNHGLRTLIETVIRKSESIENYKVVIGEKVLLCNASSLTATGVDSKMFLLTLEEVNDGRKAAEETKIIGAGVGNNITARKNDEADLWRKTALLEATVNSIPDGYIVYGPDRSIIRMNDIAEKILGFTEEKRYHPYEERINQLQAQTSTGDPFPLENIPSNRAFNGETVRNEIMEVCRPGRHYWLSVSAAPIIADDGSMHGVVMEFADITDLKMLEKQLQEERDLSAAVIQTSGALITVLDRSGKIKRFNKAAEELTGYTADEVTGHSLFDLFIPFEEREAVKSIAIRLFAGESRVDFENHWITKKGEKRFIRWRNSILHDKNRKPVYAVATGIDITDRKRIEDAWRASEDQLRNERNILRMVVNNLPYSFILLSPDLRVEYTNETINDRFGFDTEQARGKTVHELFPEEILDLYLPLLREVKETGIPFSGEISYHVKGIRVTNIPNIVPLYDDKNEIQHLIILSVDITERKKMEDAIRESEEKFRNMFESHGAIMLIIDPQSGEIINANSSAAKFYGYTREELRKINIRKINHISDDEIKTEMQEAKANEQNYFIFEHELADGSVRPVEVYSTPVQIEGRTLLFSVIHDISERMKAEKALFEKEASLRRAQEIAQLGSWELDLTTNRLTWSDEIYRIFGLHPQEFKATYEAFLDHVHPDDRDVVDSAYTKSVREGLESYDIDHRVIRKSTGEIRYVHEKCQHVRNSNGQIVRSIGMVHDITDRKKAEIALLQRSEELAEANKELESFSYSVSHDLRSPLTAIHGFSNLLLENYNKVLDDNGKSFLNFIIGAADKMASIIDDLMKMARITRETMNCQDTDLSLIASSIVDELRKSDPQRKTLINITDKMPAFADPGLITIALTNLIGNAWKYTGKNDETRIDIGRTDMNDNEKAYFIRDNGAGFDMKFSHRLFHPFERLHSDSDFTGTGIGLTIVQKIIHRHGGRIWAESEEGRGAVFYFTLKCR